MKRSLLISISLASACIALSSGLGSTQCSSSCGESLGSATRFASLYSFAGQPDGVGPQGNLVQDSAGDFYGTTALGGGANLGTVFKLSKSSETVLYSFAGSPDGAHPQAGVIIDSVGNLYGTTQDGGNTGVMCPVGGCGVVFKVDSTGKETILHSFMGTDGAAPRGGLVRDTLGNLYGTTVSGGTGGSGVVFKLDPSGTETVLSDGGSPAGLILDDSGNLYGTIEDGGILNCSTSAEVRPPINAGCGTVFKMDATGMETVLYSFTGGNNGPDGAFPNDSLIRDKAGNLYGNTLAGGKGVCAFFPTMPSEQPVFPLYCGTVFKLDPTGAETLLHKFAAGADGVSPKASLVLDATGNLYGTTTNGGTGSCFESAGGLDDPRVDVGCGTIFKIDASGNETVVYNFSGPDGRFPRAGLFVDSAGILYGTTLSGGAFGVGNVFRYDPGSGPATFTLSVTLAGSGSGLVSSNPSGISCGTACSASFDSGAPVALSAQASSGSQFAGWSGACTGSGDCSVTVVAAESVTATFNVLPPPDFTMAPASASFTMQTGAQVTDALALTGKNGFSGQVNLSCTVSGPAPLATCAVSPSSVSFGANSGTSTLTITAPTSLVAFAPPLTEGGRLLAIAVALPVPGFLLCAIGLRSRCSRRRGIRLWFLGSSVIALLMVLTGCGGSSAPPPPPKNYTVTITATSATGSIQHSTPIAITVE